MALIQDIPRIVLIGIGATACMDLWLALLKRFGVQTLNFAFIGRWVGHLFHGQIAHAAIAKSPPIAYEKMVGWSTHYLVGIAFAVLLIATQGLPWLQQPSVGPALLVGMGTVVAPLFLMQPTMGSGFAASHTPTPLKNSIRSLINHTVFGAGLYLSAALLQWIFN